MKSSSNKLKQTKAEAEVEELLKAVEEEMFLNLSVNSHISRVAPDYIPSDLDRRFRALQNNRQPQSQPQPQPQPSSAVDSDLDAVLGGDLTARFAALRASLPAPAPVPENFGEEEDEDEDEDEQVERLIRWAKDAARLDPSPPSDDDYDQDEDPLSVK